MRLVLGPDPDIQNKSYLVNKLYMPNEMNLLLTLHVSLNDIRKQTDKSVVQLICHLHNMYN